MNLIRCTSRLLRTSKLQYKPILPVRGAIYLDKDWQPGPYPKTEAERLAAAKKYNLLPEEYEAYDPEKWEFSYGDYPLLPNICQDDKDPYYAWDYPAWKYNYGEVIHVNEELYQFDRLTLRPVTDIPFKEVVLVYFLALGFMYIYTWLCWTYDAISLLKPAHLITPGKVYYHYPSSNLQVYEKHEH